MEQLQFKKNEWIVEQTSLKKIAQKVGTPTYVYSLSTIEKNYFEIDQAYQSIPHLIAYAMKANSNLTIVQTLAKLGAGADVVSGGEIFKAIKAGIPPKKIIFSGVGKLAEEIKYAIQMKIRIFNVESIEEILLLDKMAQQFKQYVSIAIRFNPDVDAHTHHYISTGKRENKFGIDLNNLNEIIKVVRNSKHLKWNGVHAHIGSQMTQTRSLTRAAQILSKLVSQLRGEAFPIQTVNLGGGYGIQYKEQVPKISSYANPIVQLLKDQNVDIIVEPGRYIVGNAGVLLTRISYVKKKLNKIFYIVDAGMTDLIRPALYGAYHQITALDKSQKSQQRVDIVGPICESADFLAQNRAMPVLKSGDLLVVFSAGAYGSSMASNYNVRPYACEVAVRKKMWKIVRKRQTWNDLIQNEIQWIKK
jgi:diaminopimelate decarboxylase